MFSYLCWEVAAELELLEGDSHGVGTKEEDEGHEGQVGNILTGVPHQQTAVLYTIFLIHLTPVCQVELHREGHKMREWTRREKREEKRKKRQNKGQKTKKENNIDAINSIWYSPAESCYHLKEELKHSRPGKMLRRRKHHRKNVNMCRVHLLSPTVHEIHISFSLYGAYTLFRRFILRLQVNQIFSFLLYKILF